MPDRILVLFDGNAIIHRAYHAFLNTRPLTVGKTGEIVSAVYGFANILLKTVSDIKPTHWAIAFDKAEPTFRHEMYVEYKAHRPKTPDELVNQFARVRELVAAFNIPVFELAGYEADDVIGTLCRQASEQDVDTVIVTGDADSMQLVGMHVKVLYPKGGKFGDAQLYDDKAVYERYRVKPENIADYKALVGDPSDNIPGVKGIGEKTAVKLIQTFGTIEEIYTHLDKVTPSRVQELLRSDEAAGRQSKILATIVTNAPVKLDLDSCCTATFDRQRVTELFRELEFYSLVNRLPGGGGGIVEEAKKVDDIPHHYRMITTGEDLDNLVRRLSGARSLAIDLVTDEEDAMSAHLVGIAVSPAEGEAYYIPTGHAGLSAMLQLPLALVVSRLKPIFEDMAHVKLGHDTKFDTTLLAENGVFIKNITFDIMVAAYLLGEKALSLKPLAFNRLKVEMTPVTDLTGQGSKQIKMSEVGMERVCEYACAEVNMTMRLAGLFAPELDKQGLWLLFADVEMPLIPVLVHMERSGVMLDVDLLNKMSHELGARIEALEKQIYFIVGHEFNISSPQQLSAVLFQEMHLTSGKKLKGGGYSTGAAILEELRGVHPVIDLVLDFRQLVKLKSTYVDALPCLINKRTSRVHTCFNQTKTATGRLSSTDPNLQNIPVRGELGRQIRHAFIVPPGTTLLAGDYSQIDLRVLAHLSQDPNLLEAFNRDEDIHSATAAQIYGVGVAQITPDMRRLAKTVNFGVIYGMSEYGLEQATDLSREEARKFIAAYFEKYAEVKHYLESTKQLAREKGFVKTLLGRRRQIPEINSANRMVREGAERMAINMPVQGTSADIIKVAMINMYREINERRLTSKMLLQVHDELLFEVVDEELSEMKKLVSDIMSSAVCLLVPLKVTIKVGHNWGELE